MKSIHFASRHQIKAIFGRHQNDRIGLSSLIGEKIYNEMFWIPGMIICTWFPAPLVLPILLLIIIIIILLLLVLIIKLAAVISERFPTTNLKTLSDSEIVGFQEKFRGELSSFCTLVK